MILTDPLVKFIDYGNAVFEGQKKSATKFSETPNPINPINPKPQALNPKPGSRSQGLRLGALGKGAKRSLFATSTVV